MTGFLTVQQHQWAVMKAEDVRDSLLFMEYEYNDQ